jgi:hypothetical protein
MTGMMFCPAASGCRWNRITVTSPWYPVGAGYAREWHGAAHGRHDVKITTEDFEALKAAVSPLVTDEVRAAYRKTVGTVSDPDKRLRWDAYSAAMRATGWQLQDRLYTYLTDAHIDTALKRIVPPLSGAR